MSLAIMAKQCTIPSFWGSLPASEKRIKPAKPKQSSVEIRAEIVFRAIKKVREISTDDVITIVQKTDPAATRNMVAHALRGLHEAKKITKKVRRATKMARFAYWSVA